MVDHGDLVERVSTCWRATRYGVFARTEWAGAALRGLFPQINIRMV